jgi:hypothetical protein
VLDEEGCGAAAAPPTAALTGATGLTGRLRTVAAGGAGAWATSSGVATGVSSDSGPDVSEGRSGGAGASVGLVATDGGAARPPDVLPPELRENSGDIPE